MSQGSTINLYGFIPTSEATEENPNRLVSVSFPVAAMKYTGKSNLRRKEFILAHRVRFCSIMMRKSWYQELGAVRMWSCGHVIMDRILRELGMMNTGA